MAIYITPPLSKRQWPLKVEVILQDSINFQNAGYYDMFSPWNLLCHPSRYLLVSGISWFRRNIFDIFMGNIDGAWSQFRQNQSKYMSSKWSKTSSAAMPQLLRIISLILSKTLATLFGEENAAVILIYNANPWSILYSSWKPLVWIFSIYFMKGGNIGVGKYYREQINWSGFKINQNRCWWVSNSCYPVRDVSKNLLDVFRYLLATDHKHTEQLVD